MADPKYTSGTFSLKIKEFGSADTLRSIGNIVIGAAGEINKVLEHELGRTGSIDKRIRLRQAFYVNFTFDELNEENLAMALQSEYNSVTKEIDIGDVGELPEFEGEIEHKFLDGSTLTIHFHKANIVPQGEEIVNFPAMADAWAQSALRISSLASTEAEHEDQEHGYIKFAAAGS